MHKKGKKAHKVFRLGFRKPPKGIRRLKSKRRRR